MTAQSNFPMNDLILRLAGGHRDGELIPVKTQKCFLGVEEGFAAGSAEQPQCAIFRGPNGAAVRSYGDQVSVNGIAATVHWLKEGDRIEFPNSMTVEVAQLGWVETACQELDDFSGQSAEPEADRCQLADPGEQFIGPNQCDSQCENNESGDQPEFVFEQDSESQECVSKTVLSSNLPEVNHDDARLNMIESQIGDMQSLSFQAEQRLDRFESQLVALTEQISQLVSLYSGTAGEQKSDEESFVTVGNVETLVSEQPADSCSYEQNTESNANNAIEENADPQSLGDFYSYQDDDDEKIMTFESDSEAMETGMATNVEITDPQPELNSIEQSEIDSRLSEMERVFGGSLDEAENADDESTLSATQPTANEQLLELFESPTHGLDEVADSFAENTKSGPSDSVATDSLASQLLGDILSSDSPSNEPHTEAVSEENVEVAETEAEESSSFQSTSSVADLLAKMKAEGQWSGIPDEEEPVEQTPEPAETVAVPVEPTSSNESEDDVEDYMTQLLNRMRGGQPAAPPKKPAVKLAKQKPKAKEVPEEVVFVAPANPLKPEEFKPVRQAQRIELGAMRELANSTTRHAVHASEQIRLKELGYLQIGIAIASFFMSIYYFLWNSKAFMDTGFCVGLICTGIAGFLGYRFYSTIKYNETIPAELGKDQKSNPERGKSAEEPVAG